MNTQTQVHALEAGQAFAIAADRRGQLILLEGEVWVHAPARWLAGTMVLPQPARASAPACLPLDGVAAVTGIDAAKLVIEEAPGWFAALRAFAALLVASPAQALTRKACAARAP
jgi:hypothetical protein